MEIVECHSNEGTDENQELCYLLLLVFMNLFEPPSSSLQVFNFSSASNCSMSNSHKDVNVCAGYTV
jgi:hypothetical protein